ncbi:MULTISPECIES: type 1 glutamine amidotransferase [unclassified Enterococcus]|uniref:type 1 glutamine amidotransferase n=1 Tax=unclassified Enterococcus TaxID=2608891 RepID=UPI0015568AC9|nr:type 1 glutamine amidotransferase [Enterococcus sp. MMGLQ5-2]MBS7584723.1 type 1 glutamine amidotransferase [Enterococcus sp. MMGLQ5-1]NPD37018.1 type 1 glutamine amidotransferase [Enterococcus sp. MMGLQ5-2]
MIQHVSFEGLGYLEEWLINNNHELLLIKIFEEPTLPNPSDFDYLIILGGPMSVNDQEAWLSEERQLIKRALELNLPIFGICLGAQQLAKVLGAEIIPTPKEVGWGQINISATLTLSTAKSYQVLHWHSEGFTLPEQAELIAQSQSWRNQGFRYDRAIGLQFHLETNAETRQELLKHDAQFIKDNVLNQTEEKILKHSIEAANKELLFDLLNSIV